MKGEKKKLTSWVPRDFNKSYLGEKNLNSLAFFFNAVQNPADNLGHNFKITVYFILEKNTQNYEKRHLVDASNIDVFICNFFEKSKKKKGFPIDDI